jgi:hypothetical protein
MDFNVCHKFSAATSAPVLTSQQEGTYTTRLADGQLQDEKEIALQTDLLIRASCYNALEKV